MVTISRETAEQTDERLRRIITRARLRVYPGSYAFLEFPVVFFPMAARADALAFVGTTRSGVSWCPAQTMTAISSRSFASIFRRMSTTAASWAGSRHI
jgi:hypothetical protein